MTAPAAETGAALDAALAGAMAADRRLPPSALPQKRWRILRRAPAVAQQSARVAGMADGVLADVAHRADFGAVLAQAGQVTRHGRQAAAAALRRHRLRALRLRLLIGLRGALPVLWRLTVLGLLMAGALGLLAYQDRIRAYLWPPDPPAGGPP